jgi:hypothetical protein
MNPLWPVVIGWILLSSLTGFVLMGIDKSRAVHHDRRVREMTLYKIAAVGGAFGIVAGSGVFHHKTVKDSFTDVSYVAAVAWLLVLLELQNLLGPPIG